VKQTAPTTPENHYKKKAYLVSYTEKNSFDKILALLLNIERFKLFKMYLMLRYFKSQLIFGLENVHRKTKFHTFYGLQFKQLFP